MPWDSIVEDSEHISNTRGFQLLISVPSIIMYVSSICETSRATGYVCDAPWNTDYSLLIISDTQKNLQSAPTVSCAHEQMPKTLTKIQSNLAHHFGILDLSHRHTEFCLILRMHISAHTIIFPAPLNASIVNYAFTLKYPFGINVSFMRSHAWLSAVGILPHKKAPLQTETQTYKQA